MVNVVASVMQEETSCLMIGQYVRGYDISLPGVGDGGLTDEGTEGLAVKPGLSDKLPVVGRGEGYLGGFDGGGIVPVTCPPKL